MDGQEGDQSKSDLRTRFLGKSVEVKGKIFEKDTGLPIRQATVEIWHLAPGSNARYKGRMQTNVKGEYRLLTDFPSREKGKHYKIQFKVSKNKKQYKTELSFNDFGAHISAQHWEENNQLEESLLFPTHQTFFNRSTITFNFLFNH